MDSIAYDFIEACRDGDLNKVKEYIENGVDIEVKNLDYETPLFAACICGRTEVVNFLLKNGANIEARNFAGNTP